MTGFDPIGGPLRGPLGGALEGAKPLQPKLVGEPGDERVGGGDEAAPAFSSALADAIDHVSALSKDVTDKTEALAMGKPVELHDLMLAMGKSEVAFNLMLEVRNKIVDAWERLSRSVV